MTYSVSQFDIEHKEDFVEGVNHDPDSVLLVNTSQNIAGTVREVMEHQNYISVTTSPYSIWSARIVKDIDGNIKAY